MQRILTAELWKVVRSQARNAIQRNAAIAYVTQDLIGFKGGDSLVINASTNAIASGETSAKLLRDLQRKKVQLFNCPGLHAKVILLDKVAVIGSGNMSLSSLNGLVEAAVMTDHLSILSGVASMIEQLKQKSEKLSQKRISELCRIKVVRKGGRGSGKGHKTAISPLSSNTWLVGVRQLKREPSSFEQQLAEQAKKKIKLRYKNAIQEPEWIRWFGKGRFITDCREGDSIIQIWRSSRAKRPSTVIYPVPILLKEKVQNRTYLYVPEATGTNQQMRWGRFQKLIKSLGYSRRLGPTITHLLEPDFADAISRKWNHD